MPRGKKQDPAGEAEDLLDPVDEDEDDEVDDSAPLDAELDDELDVLDDEDEDELDDFDDEDEDEADVVASDEDDEDEDEDEEEDEDEDGPSSLDQLLEKRSAARSITDDADDDDELLALASEDGRTAKKDKPLAPVIPLKDKEEFVCRSCFLVKAKVQLANPERQLCRDCV